MFQLNVKTKVDLIVCVCVSMLSSYADRDIDSVDPAEAFLSPVAVVLWEEQKRNIFSLLTQLWCNPVSANMFVAWKISHCCRLSCYFHHIAFDLFFPFGVMLKCCTHPGLCFASAAPSWSDIAFLTAVSGPLVAFPWLIKRTQNKETWEEMLTDELQHI